MVRKLSFVVFAVVLMVIGCGRQVTPNKTTGPSGAPNGGSLPSGFVQIRFTTAAPMDFANYRYVIVFNTSGNGQTPYANAYLTNFLNYSFAFEVVGNNGAIGQPLFFQYIAQTAGVPASAVPLQYVYGQQLFLVPRLDGMGFTLQFQRSMFLGLATAPPSPGATPTPVPSGSAAPTPTPGATATPTPGVLASQWAFNCFVLNTSASPVSSMGIGGASDTSFIGKLDVSQPFDTTFVVPAGAVPAPTQAAQIVQVEIANSP